jgi:hypothetical protein
MYISSGPCSADIKNGGPILPLPFLFSRHSAYLIKRKDNFALIYMYTRDLEYDLNTFRSSPVLSDFIVYLFQSLLGPNTSLSNLLSATFRVCSSFHNNG